MNPAYGLMELMVLVDMNLEPPLPPRKRGVPESERSCPIRHNELDPGTTCDDENGIRHTSWPKRKKAHLTHALST